MSTSPFDPEYPSVARFLPRGIARWWNLRLIRMLGALTGLSSDPENVEISETGAVAVRVHRRTSFGDAARPKQATSRSRRGIRISVVFRPPGSA